MAAVRSTGDSVLLEPCGDSDPDLEEAAGMVLFLSDSRRVQKVLWRQLFVLDSMMSLLEGLECVQQLMAQPCPSLPEGVARRRWKALKGEDRSELEETEMLLRCLQDQAHNIHDRKQKLAHLVQQLHGRKQQCEQHETLLHKAQKALLSCDQQLKQLKKEAGAVISQLITWQSLRDELQGCVAAMLDFMQINLLAFNQSELSVEIRPRLCSILSSNKLESLKLSVTWDHADQFRLQVDEGTVGLVEGCLSGRWAEFSTTLLEVIQCYVCQAELLSEVQALRSSFAIDWRPSQRLLVYLKTSSLVCHLKVEEGYPHSGRAQLLSVRRDGQPVDTSELKPRKADLSLTEWLVFLCSSPLI
ncbi:uncharacterized protein si:dkey-225f5.4 [Nothobranchius furzeri]|uniref:LOC107395202-like protein n=1 Tax=Nothobranchius furzeri TaxID=105023 RepID=A0A1A7ZRF3_NOTFU|nr:uncharacterized protein si:dkey-225f5.4 [Nothobranchius furzeri]KAF7227397.1 putative LOC107395202-like protein [Nothobranchius furzeri]